MRESKSLRELTAPVNGTTVPLADLPDPAFAQGMLGEGVAIDPGDGRFCSPCKGEIIGVTDTAHAYNILTDDGLELLLHIGIDTVELKGRGFAPKVKAGDRVNVGDLLAEVDLSILRDGGYSPLTPLIITNSETVGFLERVQGTVRCGQDAVLRYEIAKEK